MASHVSIDMPQPITEPRPVISPGIQPRDPQLQAATAIPLGVNPAQPPVDARDAEAQRGTLVYCFTGVISFACQVRTTEILLEGCG